MMRHPIVQVLAPVRATRRLGSRGRPIGLLRREGRPMFQTSAALSTDRVVELPLETWPNELIDAFGWGRR